MMARPLITDRQAGPPRRTRPEGDPAHVRSLVTRRRLVEMPKARGMQANQQVTFLTGDGEDIRGIPCYFNAQAELRPPAGQHRGDAQRCVSRNGPLARVLMFTTFLPTYRHSIKRRRKRSVFLFLARGDSCPCQGDGGRSSKRAFNRGEIVAADPTPVEPPPNLAATTGIAGGIAARLDRLPLQPYHWRFVFLAQLFWAACLMIDPLTERLSPAVPFSHHNFS